MEFEIWHLILAFLVILNLWISTFLIRRDDLEPFQKGAQVFLVWLIPFFAGLGLWLFHKSNDEEPVKKNEFGGGSNENSGTHFGGE